MEKDPVQMVVITVDELKKIIRNEIQSNIDHELPVKRKKFLTFKEACEYLNCASPTLYRATSEKTIKFFKRNRILLFTEDQLNEYLERNSNN